jgi:hypothetical protein
MWSNAENILSQSVISMDIGTKEAGNAKTCAIVCSVVKLDKHTEPGGFRTYLGHDGRGVHDEFTGYAAQGGYCTSGH